MMRWWSATWTRRALVSWWGAVRSWWSDAPTGMDWEAACRVIDSAYRELVADAKTMRADHAVTEDALTELVAKVAKYEDDVAARWREADDARATREADLVATVGGLNDSLALASDRIALLEGVLTSLQPGIDLAHLDRNVATRLDGGIEWVGPRLVPPGDRAILSHPALRRGNAAVGATTPTADDVPAVADAPPPAWLKRSANGGRRVTRLTTVPTPTATPEAPEDD